MVVMAIEGLEATQAAISPARIQHQLSDIFGQLARQGFPPPWLRKGKFTTCATLQAQALDRGNRNARTYIP
jgi:hypothetical protein